MSRANGILMAISSLPSKYGIGCFSESAFKFVDQLKNAGQKYWQILPLGPTGYGDSPYQSFSTYAGNPYYISLEKLIDKGLLTEEECKNVDWFSDPMYVDYEKIFINRFRLLKMAYERSKIKQDERFITFCDKNSWWLDDYALFMAIKDSYQGKSWDKWNQDIRMRTVAALEYYKNNLYSDIEFYKFIQYEFAKQWSELKDYANKNGISIIGDIPIYVAYDSADTWSKPELFQLNEENLPIAVAGCPPDAFARQGQLWGNPLYCWEYHKKQNYSWWIKRIERSFELYDAVRIDHFRGFDEYYSIPYGDSTAENGHWEKGPGIELFSEIKKKVGNKLIIAEDLGFVTDSVRKLVEDSGYPGMKIIEFAFDSRDTGCAADYLPHNYKRNSVVYTGTHDNETLVSWWKQISDEERKTVRDYLFDYNTSDKEIHKSIIALVMRSVADICIIPIQDFLGLDNSARMNKPSTLGNNWTWRLLENQFDEELQIEICSMAVRYGRI